MSLEKNISAFLRRCEDKRLSPATLRQYRSQLNQLAGLIECNYDIGAYLRAKEISTHSTTLRLWHQFVNESAPHLKAKFKSLDLPRVPLKVPKFLSPHEVETLKAADIPLRLKLPLLLMLEMGMRIAEVKNSKVQHIKNDWIEIKRKGGNIQRLPLSQGVREILGRLNLSPTDSLMEIGIRGFQKYLAKVSSQLLGRSINPHALRHTFATEAMRSGARIDVLKDFLGHANIATTSRYCHTVGEDMQNLLGTMEAKRL